MYTYQILIEYDGSNFVGWQIQKNGISVQEILEKALGKLLKKKRVNIYGSGRTDAGVHAFEQSAHFKVEQIVKNKKNFLKSLNFFLKKHLISVLDIKKKTNTFHARFSAKKRMYKYFIKNRTSPLSLEKDKAWHVRKKLNLDLMTKGAKILKGTKDFSTYRASSCTAKNPVRSLNEVKIKNIKDKIEISFSSRSFLQQQVRSMVGCLKYLGEKKWTVKKFKQVMLSKKRANCAPPAPAHGLYLFKVTY